MSISFLYSTYSIRFLIKYFFQIIYTLWIIHIIKYSYLKHFFLDLSRAKVSIVSWKSIDGNKSCSEDNIINDFILYYEYRIHKKSRKYINYFELEIHKKFSSKTVMKIVNYLDKNMCIVQIIISRHA